MTTEDFMGLVIEISNHGIENPIEPNMLSIYREEDTFFSLIDGSSMSLEKEGENVYLTLDRKVKDLDIRRDFENLELFIAGEISWFKYQGINHCLLVMAILINNQMLPHLYSFHEGSMYAGNFPKNLPKRYLPKYNKRTSIMPVYQLAYDLPIK